MAEDIGYPLAGFRHEYNGKWKGRQPTEREKRPKKVCKKEFQKSNNNKNILCFDEHSVFTFIQFTCIYNAKEFLSSHGCL